MVFWKIKEKVGLGPRRMPNHIGITMRGSIEYARKNGLKPEEIILKRFENVISSIKLAVKLNIPILTFYAMPSNLENREHYNAIVDSVTYLFQELAKWDFLHQNQIKVAVLGKWYDLPGRAVDQIKKTLEATRDYDKFFVNFCVNYHGQDEIVDAIKLVVRSVKAERIDGDVVSRDTVKEHIYSSYFLPPDLIICTGQEKSLGGFMLWDSVNSIVYFSEVLWPDFSQSDVTKAIEYYQKK